MAKGWGCFYSVCLASGVGWGAQSSGTGGWGDRAGSKQSLGETRREGVLKEARPYVGECHRCFNFGAIRFEGHVPGAEERGPTW